MIEDPKTMFDFINNVKESKFFGERSPFQCNVDFQNPKLCVVTGPNVSGKSLLRKIFHSHFSRASIEFINLSQEGRCSGGIIKSLIYGNEIEDSTGYNSAKIISTAFKTGHNRTKKFTLLFDEPEIGCGEELQLLIGERIADQYDKMINSIGVIIITHSRVIAKELMKHNPTHLSLAKDVGLNNWINRSVEKPSYSLEDLVDTGYERWKQVESLIKDKL